MKTKITQLTMLIIALVFFNANLNAQSGDFEFLFDTDGDAEGFVLFNGGTIAVSGGVLNYTYNSASSGFEQNPPASDIYLEKAAFPYLAIKLSHTPASRVLFYLKTNGTGAWYDNKATNGEVNAALNDEHIFLYDMSGDHFTTTALNDGLIERIIFTLDNSADAAGINTSVDVEWIKTFASVQAIIDYNATLSTDNFEKSQAKIISGDKKLQIVNSELNSNIQIFDILGKKIYDSVSKSSKLTVDIDTTGLYIVKITNEKGLISTQKAMVY